jgi:integral membrane protein
LNVVRLLRRIAFLEGVSFLVLLGVAMPLKYIGGMLMPVKIAGWAHGILFLVFCAALLRVKLVARWPVSRCAIVFAAGLLPFGPFLLDRRMTEWEQTDRARNSG